MNRPMGTRGPFLRIGERSIPPASEARNLAANTTPKAFLKPSGAGARGPGGHARISRASDIEAKTNHVSFLNDVILALEAPFARFLGAAFAS